MYGTRPGFNAFSCPHCAPLHKSIASDSTAPAMQSLHCHHSQGVLSLRKSLPRPLASTIAQHYAKPTHSGPVHMHCQPSQVLLQFLAAYVPRVGLSCHPSAPVPSSRNPVPHCFGPRKSIHVAAGAQHRRVRETGNVNLAEQCCVCRWVSKSPVLMSVPVSGDGCHWKECVEVGWVQGWEECECE